MSFATARQFEEARKLSLKERAADDLYEALKVAVRIIMSKREPFASEQRAINTALAKAEGKRA